MEWSRLTCSMLFYFHVNALTFPREVEEISVIVCLFILPSQLETSVRLVVDYSKYPRIVAGRISNWLLPTLLAALPPKQYSAPTLIPPATQANGPDKKESTNRNEHDIFLQEEHF